MSSPADKGCAFTRQTTSRTIASSLREPQARAHCANSLGAVDTSLPSPDLQPAQLEQRPHLSPPASRLARPSPPPPPSLRRTICARGVTQDVSTATPASSCFTATTGRSASERRDWYSMPPVSAVGTLPLAARRTQPAGPDGRFRRSLSHVPCKSRRPGSRRLYAGHHLARNAGTRQADPEGLPRTPGFDAF